jgi:hypothetical protein
LLEPVFGAHLDHVAEAFGGDERRLRAAPFDQRVGDQRRAVDDLVDLATGRPRPPPPPRWMPSRIARSGARNRSAAWPSMPARMLQRHVGEGAADIDPDADPRRSQSPFTIWFAVKAMS